MIHKGREYCDLCGKVMECCRSNGWAGTLTVTLKGDGNFHIGNLANVESPRDGKWKMCDSCGKKVLSSIAEIKKEYRVVETVEYMAEPNA